LKDEVGESAYYVLRACKGSVGFIANLKKSTWLDLKECAGKLESAGYKVTDADVMLIVEKDIELTIYKSGKILARTDDGDTAKHAIEKAYDVIIGLD